MLYGGKRLRGGGYCCMGAGVIVDVGEEWGGVIVVMGGG